MPIVLLNANDYLLDIECLRELCPWRFGGQNTQVVFRGGLFMEQIAGARLG